MADPRILLFAPDSTGTLALRNRLTALGLNCLLDGGNGGEGPERCEVIVVAAPPGRALATADLPARPRGSLLASLPLVVVGEKIEPDVQADEIIPPGTADARLAERLRIWARWGGMSLRLREIESAAAKSPGLDPLTGLPGYGAFTLQLDTEVKRFERYRTPVGLVLGDIDGLRSVNDRYGHRTGDLVLHQVGELLRRAVRQVDMVMRYSGDTFAVLLPQADASATARAAARLRSVVANLIIRGDAASGGTSPLLKVTVHIGHASLPDESIQGRGGLLAAAEAALDRERKAQASPTITA